MFKLNKQRSTTAFFFSTIALFLSFISEKWGLQRTKVPETISWHEFFTERIDTVLIYTLSGFIIGYIFHHKIFKEKKFSICSNCQTTIETGDMLTCEKCGKKLEPLKGFYNRHPDLRKIKNENNS